MRYITVRALWACADVLDRAGDSLVVLASRVVANSSGQDDDSYCSCGAHVASAPCYFPREWER